MIEVIFYFSKFCYKCIQMNIQMAEACYNAGTGRKQKHLLDGWFPHYLNGSCNAMWKLGSLNCSVL